MKDGGANIATKRHNRPRIKNASQAHLGFGSYDDPSSAAVHPDSGIPDNSMIYVDGKGWFVAEDFFHRTVKGKPTPLNKIDMWTGYTTTGEQEALDPGYADVTIYSPNYKVPVKEQHSPSDQWVKHYSKMADRDYTIGKVRPPASFYSQPHMLPLDDFKRPAP